MHFLHNCGNEIALQKATHRPYVALRQTERPRKVRSSRLAVRARKNKKRRSKKMTIKTLAEKLNAWRRNREAVKELSQLSDRELNDIGIRRGDIEFIVRQGQAA
jgi:uncharacterized protein YjiS (DUF1127 family)